MNNKRKKDGKKIKAAAGYTLIELMIALCIFAIGILGICTMQVAAIHGNSTALRVTQSASLGANEFEKLMAMPYATVSSGSTTDGIYTIAWQVSAANVPITNVKTITITASWAEAGQQRSVSYVYYKAAQI